MPSRLYLRPLYQPGRSPIHGRGLVLVVDDEEGVRQVVRSMLTSLGYQVVLAGNGREAVEYYEARGSEIDLVILDLTMPAMDGETCFDELRKQNPGIRVIVSTGHAVDQTAQRLLDRGARGFVQKPFVKTELSEAVAQALSGAVKPDR